MAGVLVAGLVPLANYYWIQVFEAPCEGVPPRLGSAGRGVDNLVRVNGHWLIKLRNETPES